MKILQIIAIALIITFSRIPVFAGEYNVLVIPYCAIDTTRQNKMGHVDIEEMLARKFIAKMENDGMANAPTVSVLNISIKNNPNFVRNAADPMINVKALSKSYGVSRVLIIKSKTEVQNPNQQKVFWTKLDLPVITHPESNIRLVTTVTMYNAQSDSVIWSDVYYKQINKMGMIGDDESITAKISAINDYYDELIPKVLDNIEGSKETHAIMLTSLPEDAFVEDKVTAENPIVAFFENIRQAFEKRRLKKEKIKREKLAEKTKKNQIKPNLTMQEKLTEQNNNLGFFGRLKKTFNWKFYVVKQDFKIKSILKEFQNEDEKKDDTVQKTAEKLLKEKQKQREKEGKYHQKAKEQKPSIIDSIETKYNKLRTDSAQKKAEKEKLLDESVKYKTVIMSDDEMETSANRYLHVKPRSNSRNYSPKFNSEVNDI